MDTSHYHHTGCLTQTSESTLSHHLWGFDDIALADDPDNATGAAHWQVIPTTVEQLVGWMVVQDKERSTISDPSRLFDVVHAGDTTADNRSYLLQVRAVGIATDFNVAEGGSWDRNAGSKHRALQFMQISDLPGDTTEAWATQLEAVANLRYVALRLTPGARNAHASLDMSPRSHLFFGRPAFVGSETKTHSAPSRRHQPHRRHHHSRPVRALESVGAVPVFKRLSTGETAPMSHVLLNKGDLVDVSFSLDVATLRDRRVVHLRLESVVQLKTAAEVGQVTRGTITSEVFLPVPIPALSPVRRVRAAPAQEGSAQREDADDATMVAAGTL